MNTLTVLTAILTGMTIITIIWVIKAIREARELKPAYVLNIKTHEIHKIGCSRVKGISKKDQAILDQEEVKILFRVNNCKRCGGLV